MSADGVADPREAAMMQKHDRRAPAVPGPRRGGGAHAVDLSTDAIRFAGSAIGTHARDRQGPAGAHPPARRVRHGRRGRGRRRPASSRASCSSSRRCASRCGSRRSRPRAIVRAARAGQLAAYLDDRYLRVKSMISVAAEVFALRALARAMANDDHRFKVRDFFAAIPDLALSTRRARHRAVSRVPPAARARRAGVRRARARRRRRCPIRSIATGWSSTRSSPSRRRRCRAGA